MSTRSEQAGPARPAGHSARHGHPRPEPHVIVLFGATGDLAKRKLLPGWFHLYAAGLLPKEFRLIGSAPPDSAMTDEQFREHAEESCEEFCITKPEDGPWAEFAANLTFAAAEPVLGLGTNV